MGERHNDALYAQIGAVNPTALSEALRKATIECREVDLNIRTDAACRLIAHQIAHLFDLGCVLEPEDYSSLCAECVENAGAIVVAAYKRTYRA